MNDSNQHDSNGRGEHEELPPVQDPPQGVGGLSAGDELLPEVQQQDVRAFATRYVAFGWEQLPLHTMTAAGVCSCVHIDCPSPAKHPRTQSGHKDASADRAVVEAWFARWPDANIGIRVGGQSGPVVLDVDPRHSGDESLADLLEEYGPLPHTPEVRTGGGGRHFYFAPSSELAHVTKKTVAPGLDFLADRAYVVAPPSLHASGERYEWAPGRAPWDIPLAPPDEWLIALATDQVLQDTRSLADILDEMGPLSADASADDVERFRTRAAELLCSGRLGGRNELLRAAAVGLLGQVKLISNPATVMREAVHQRSVELRLVREQLEEPEPVPPELLEKAHALLENPGLLDIAATTMTRLGLRGEEINRRVIILAAVGGHLEEPIHLVIHGASSGGKNQLIRCVTALLPPDRVLSLSGLSSRALEYRGGLIDGVLVIDEAEGQQDAAYGLRVAMSEGRVTRLTVNRSESGHLESEELTVEVRASIITTTTAPALNEENQTRVFDLWIDESTSLTAEVIRAYADAAAGVQVYDRDELLLVWHVAMRLLVPATVVIPYARIIGDAFPASPLRARRDFQRTLAVIRGSALFHQFQRDRDEEACIVASVEDYRHVYPLVQAVLGPSMTGLTEKARELCQLHNEMAVDTRDGWIRRAELQHEAGRRGVASPVTVQKWSERLRDLGIWDGRKVRGAWEHRAMRDFVTEAIPLPTPDELSDAS